MASFNMINGSSRSLCIVMFAVVLATLLTLSPLASAEQNISYVLNGITDKALMTQVVFVRCSFNFGSYRTFEPYGTVLKPGEEKTVYVDAYPGVKQVECDITRYGNNTNFLYNMKTVVWFFMGPSQTRFRFENSDMHFAVPPSLNNTNLGTSMQWSFDQQRFFTPKFFTSSSASARSSNGLLSNFIV